MNPHKQIAPFQRVNRGRPLIFGHRGAKALEPENSIRAFQRALEDGADGVELDVRMTGDGELVIAHDESLFFDQSPQPIEVGTLSRAQISQLTVQDQAVPSLRDALKFRAETGCLMNIELKSNVANPLWMAREAVRLIGLHGASSLLISSFDPRQLAIIRTLFPTLPTALLVEEDQTLMARAIRFTFLGADGVHPQSTVVTKQIVDRAVRVGGFVNVWTVNDPELARGFVALGVDGLVTDNPRAVVRALRS